MKTELNLADFLNASIANQVKEATEANFLGRFVEFKTSELALFAKKLGVVLKDTEPTKIGRVLDVSINALGEVEVYVEFGRMIEGSYTYLEPEDKFLMGDIIVTISPERGWKPDLNFSPYKDK